MGCFLTNLLCYKAANDFAGLDKSHDILLDDLVKGLDRPG